MEHHYYFLHRAGVSCKVQMFAAWCRCLLHGAGVCCIVQVLAARYKCLLHGAGVCCKDFKNIYFPPQGFQKCYLFYFDIC